MKSILFLESDYLGSNSEVDSLDEKHSVFGTGIVSPDIYFYIFLIPDFLEVMKLICEGSSTWERSQFYILSFLCKAIKLKNTNYKCNS